MNNTQNAKKQKPFWHFIVIVLAVSAVIYVLSWPLIREELIARQASESVPAQTGAGNAETAFSAETIGKIMLLAKEADYDDVLEHPENYEDNYIVVTGTIRSALFDGETGAELIFLKEPEDPDHTWVISYSPALDAGYSYEKGENVTAYCSLLEIMEYPETDGTVSRMPELVAYHMDYASLSAPTANPSDVLTDDNGDSYIVAENAVDTVNVTVVVPILSGDPETSAPETLSDLDLLEQQVAERREHFRSLLNGDSDETEDPELAALLENYVKWYPVNTSTKVIHEKKTCPAAEQILPENLSYTDDPAELLADGYRWCGRCH